MSGPQVPGEARQAASAAHEAALLARDLCLVLRQALNANGESFGPPLLSALATVAGLAEDYAETAMDQAWTATGHPALPLSRTAT